MNMPAYSGRYPWGNKPISEENLKKMEEHWEKLGDIPVNDDGEIQEPFMQYPVGTDREEIWRFFDEFYPGGVAKLMHLDTEETE